MRVISPTFPAPTLVSSGRLSHRLLAQGVSQGGGFKARFCHLNGARWTCRRASRDSMPAQRRMGRAASCLLLNWMRCVLSWRHRTNNGKSSHVEVSFAGGSFIGTVRPFATFAWFGRSLATRPGVRGAFLTICAAQPCGTSSGLVCLEVSRCRSPVTRPSPSTSVTILLTRRILLMGLDVWVVLGTLWAHRPHQRPSSGRRPKRVNS